MRRAREGRKDRVEAQWWETGENCALRTGAQAPLAVPGMAGPLTGDFSPGVAVPARFAGLVLGDRSVQLAMGAVG